MSEDKLKELFKHLESQGAVVIVDQITEDGNLHIPLDLLKGHMMSDTEREFMETLLDMAKWALEHPSKSRFEYVSPKHIKANPNLVAAFMRHYHEQIEPHITDRLRAAMDDSISRGLFPAAVIEHTPDGHHPIGWSWGSEWYIADFYLCLIRALTRSAEEAGCDMKDKDAPFNIAQKAYDLNRVNPTPEIIKAMHDRLDEPDETRSYGMIDVQPN
jgi:hypothetical protein